MNADYEKSDAALTMNTNFQPGALVIRSPPARRSIHNKNKEANV